MKPLHHLLLALLFQLLSTSVLAELRKVTFEQFYIVYNYERGFTSFNFEGRIDSLDMTFSYTSFKKGVMGVPKSAECKVMDRSRRKELDDRTLTFRIVEPTLSYARDGTIKDPLRILFEYWEEGEWWPFYIEIDPDVLAPSGKLKSDRMVIIDSQPVSFDVETLRWHN